MMIYLLNILFLSSLIFSKGDELLVSTQLGKVLGHYNEAGMREWKGIRYAQGPVGENRWTDPKFPEPSSEVFVADFNAPGCQQTCKLPPGNCPVYGQSEDCLFLTVMSPREPSPEPEGYPVLFWIHGGAFEQGLGNCALYNGTFFAQNNIVTVVINYRLGALGFMASESMGGNYGFLDQRLALQWAKSNIAGFGGNPNKITVAGQSAGAMSASLHMTSPKSQDLFNNVIMESNPFGLPYHTRETAAVNAASMMKYLGCNTDDVACMRTKSVAEILDAQDHAVKLNPNTLFINFLPFAPMIEPNGEIPEQPIYALASGKFKAVPLLAGSVYDEGQLFVYELFTKPMSQLAYNTAIKTIFGKYGSQILSFYPFEIYPGNADGRNSLNVLATDLLFYCPLRNVTRGFQATMGATAKPAYIYRFKHLLSFDCWGPDYQFCVGSVCHGSELPFVFNVFTDGETLTYYPTADEKQLSVDMVNAWANFIKNNDPNSYLAVPAKFPLYNAKEDALVVLDEPGSEDQAHVRDAYCNFWDQIGFFW